MQAISSRSVARAGGRLPGRPVRGQPRVTRRAPVVVCSATEQQKTVEEMLAAASDLMSRVEDSVQTGKKVDITASIEELEGMGYLCDESGCVLVPYSAASEVSAEEAGAKLARLLHGSNWKLGLDGAAAGSEYPAVVSGPHFTIPMTIAELGTFIEVLQHIRATVESLKADGQWTGGSVDRPLSRTKWADGRIGMQATYGTANGQAGFTLDFTLQTPHGRPVQACWPVEIVQAVADALDMEIGPLPALEKTASVAA